MSDVMSTDPTEQRTLSIFDQLINSERFQEFFRVNYEIKDDIDHENKTITTTLVEKPPQDQDFQVSNDQIWRMCELFTKAKIKNAQKLVDKILIILKQK